MPADKVRAERFGWMNEIHRVRHPWQNDREQEGEKERKTQRKL